MATVLGVDDSGHPVQFVADTKPVASGKTATAVSGAATLNALSGLVISDVLALTPGATYVITISNSMVIIGDLVFASVQFGTSRYGMPVVTTTHAYTNQVVITLQNIHATQNIAGTVLVSFMLHKT